ncbi:MAG: histidinol-phosphatase HisJ family protein [Ruminococcaceae bacterium]|nr:histidinol-phosphatase HisJ family protein [Oscillospiraceae bacterium]
MIANFHTHTTFDDGKSTAEEMVLAAIDAGFCALGFSGHGYTPFGLEYCIKDADGYIAEINRLKEKYQKKIRIYLGAEEEFYAPVNRADFEYIIGSSHYIFKNGHYHPVDATRELLMGAVDAFGGDVVATAQAYYRPFCEYIFARKPDIVGHFDLITKFDEEGEPIFTGNSQYHKIAEHYLTEALKSGCLFEVNTGAISRGYRKTPYPAENLLHVMKKNDAKLVLSSDCHHADSIACHFEQTCALLKDVGFDCTYVLLDGQIQKNPL